jgi:hypothetical protein
MAPDSMRKEWCKGGQDQYDGLWQGWHEKSSLDSMNFARAHLS